MRSTRNNNITDSERPPIYPDKKAGALSDSVILGMVRNNSAHILCFQEAVGILNQLVRETIQNAGYTGIVISQGGAKGIGCFVKGDHPARSNF